MSSNPNFSNAKQYAITATQFFIWYVANSLYAVDAQQLLRNFGSRFLILDLSFYQIIVGMAIARIAMLRRASLMNNQTLLLDKCPSSIHSILTITRIIGLLHLSATILTNFSYRILGSTSTLAWKLTEPFAAVVLKRLILHEFTHPVSFLGVACVVTGVMIFSMDTLTMLKLSPILVANILFPLRNVVIKLQQKNESEQMSTEERLFTMLSSCFPFCLFALLIKLIFEGPMIAAIPYMLRNALLFNCYQFASIALLEKLDALTHSLANTVKRVLGIVLSAGFLNETLTERHFLGLLMAAIGFPLYAIGGKTNKEGSLRKSFILVISLIAILSFGYHLNSKSSVDLRKAVRDTQGEESASSESAHSSDFLVHIARPKVKGDYTEQLDKNDILSYKGKNVGNLVWQKAAFEKLPDFSGATVCDDKADVCNRRHRSIPSSRIIHYTPVSNLFNPARGIIFRYQSNVAKRGETSLVIGAGIQAEFREDYKDIDDPEEEQRNAVERFRHRDETVSYLRLLENTSTPMLVRGDFTLATLKGVGYTHGISAGCPSLFLNRNVRLGEVMEAKYVALKKRIGDKELKVGINIQNKPGNILKFFMKLFKQYPKSIIFMQGGSDLDALSRYNLPVSRLRLYADVDAWMKSVGEMDVVIGARIHGSMLALGAGVPVFVIAPDYRVLELVQRMMIPHTTAFDDRLHREGEFDVAEFVSGSGMNGPEFDRNRCGIAKIYQKVFGRFGFGVAPHVHYISKLC